LVAHLSSLILLCCLFGPVILSAGAAQLCLGCHTAHYRDRGLCSDCHRGNPASDRKNIAHYRLIAGPYARFTLGADPVVEQGNRLLEQLACRRCHVSGGRGNRLATSLDSLVEAKVIEEIVAALNAPARGMPDFMLADSQVVALVNTLFAGSKKSLRRGSEQPLAVHFETTNQKRQDVFSLKCGACHRTLTQHWGLLGTGDIGPNLSGLLSEFYPAKFDNKRWTIDGLRRWLRNPRQLRPYAAMRPIILDESQWRELENRFTDKMY